MMRYFDRRYLKLVEEKSINRSQTLHDISVDHARRTSVWYKGMPVIFMAIDSPHGIEAEMPARPLASHTVDRNLNIRCHRKQESWRKKNDKRETWKNDENSKGSFMSNTTNFFLCISESRKQLLNNTNLKQRRRITELQSYHRCIDCIVLAKLALFQ